MNSFAAAMPTGYGATDPAYGPPGSGYGSPGPAYGPPGSNYGSSGSSYGSPGFSNGPTVVRLRNFSFGAYLNDQNGQVNGVGSARDGWGTAWEVAPVAGTNYFLIRNKMQNRYLSVENSNLLSDNSRSQASYWTIGRSYGSNTYSIRSALNNASLVYQGGAVIVRGSGGFQENADLWMVEFQ